MLRLTVPALVTTRTALSGRPHRFGPRGSSGPHTAPTARRHPRQPEQPNATPVATPTETVAAPVEAPAAGRRLGPAEPAPAPAPAAPAAAIKSTPLPSVTVTSANVHGLASTPQPSVVTEPLQDVQLTDVAH